MSILKKAHLKTALKVSFSILLVSMIITVTSCQSNHKKISTACNNTCHNHNITNCDGHENCNYNNGNYCYESENCEENHRYVRRHCHRR